MVIISLFMRYRLSTCAQSKPYSRNVCQCSQYRGQLLEEIWMEGKKNNMKKKRESIKSVTNRRTIRAGALTNDRPTPYADRGWHFHVNLTRLVAVMVTCRFACVWGWGVIFVYIIFLVCDGPPRSYRICCGCDRCERSEYEDVVVDDDNNLRIMHWNLYVICACCVLRRMPASLRLPFSAYLLT